jgi:hypothetical protein
MKVVKTLGELWPEWMATVEWWREEMSGCECEKEWGDAGDIGEVVKVGCGHRFVYGAVVASYEVQEDGGSSWELFCPECGEWFLGTGSPAPARRA